MLYWLAFVVPDRKRVNQPAAQHVQHHPDAMVDLRIEPGQAVDPEGQHEKRHAPVGDGLFIEIVEPSRLIQRPAHLDLREVIRDEGELECGKIGEDG